MTRVRAASCHYCPLWVSALWLVAGLMALLCSSACHRSAPGVDLDSGAAPHQTITGLVRGPGETPLSGRTVELVNVATGEKHRAITIADGGFTIDLPRGKYWLELPLHTGETLKQRPALLDLNRGGIDSPIEFDVAPARSAHQPSYRVDNGLGSPMA